MTYKLICDSLSDDRRLKFEDDLQKLEKQGFKSAGMALAGRALDHVCILMHSEG